MSDHGLVLVGVRWTLIARVRKWAPGPYHMKFMRMVRGLAPLILGRVESGTCGTVGRVCNAVGAGTGGLAWQMSACP